MIQQLLVFKHYEQIYRVDPIIFRKEEKRYRRAPGKTATTTPNPIQAHGDILTGRACCPLSSFSVDMRSNSNSFIRFSFSGSSSL